MATSEKQLSVTTGGGSISLPAGFPANPSAQLGSDEEIVTTVTSGRRCLEQFAKYVPDGSLRRMFAELLIAMPGWSSRRCKLTWKAKVTTFGRLFFLLQVSAPRTAENGSGLLPTVTAMDHNPPGQLRKTTIDGFRKGWRKDMSLSNYLNLGLLPTPTAREPGWRHVEIVDRAGQVPRHFNQRFYDKKTGRLVQKGLSSLLAMGMLPTPSATSDAKGGCTRSNPKRQKDTLAYAIHGTLGMPGKTSHLNPRFVLEMMGFPMNWTELPFRPGEEKA